jgi:hypothetical protein
MMLIIQISILLYKMVAGKNRVGRKQEGTREKEKQIKGVRDGV